MRVQPLVALQLCLFAVMACGSSSSSNPGGNAGASGGSPSGGAGSGGSPSGGAGAGGSAGNGSAGNGGAGSGGAGAGGSAGNGSAGAGGSAGNGSAGKGGAGSGGGAGAGGGAGSSGGAGAGGSAGAAGGSGGGGGGTTGGDAKPSKGCGVKDGPKTLTTGGTSIANGLPTSTRLKIKDREYIIDIPADYDPAHPYRLIFSWHQAYGSDTGNAVGQYPANNGPNFDAKNYAYFGLHREATAAKDPVIFVAPGGIGNFPWDYNRDVALFDDLLALVTTNLCIDESRVFTTGFSFGAMMSYALSIGRQSKLRGAVTMAAANYNFTQPTNSHAPIAYFGITGMSDGTCPWGDNTRGGKACVLQHAQDNGCTIPGDIATAKGGSKNHVCYDFEGCKAGYPVKVCTFDGNHTPSAVADGSSGGDDGLKAFVPPLAWAFISKL
jgi:predicted esterase